ncbi:MAG: iron-containing redox enzyme family protein [Candidatus Tectomicrobia bacterium]|nr:iron-containing redox enzyme family protein [Candidatus Tectomicrobia bacterium]
MALLSPEALIADLKTTLRTRHPRPHPVRGLLLQGKLTKAQLHVWAKNQFHEFRNIHRFFGVRYLKCPIPELRRGLIENIVEEEGEDLFGGKYPSHAELWTRFGEGMGIPRQEMLSYEPLPGVRAALEMYVKLVEQSHWVVAIGSGMVFEGEGPERMREEREALERHYPWIPSETLDFFRAHEYHDEGHGNFILEVLGAYCMEEHLQNEMREVVKFRTDTMWLQNESIYGAIGSPAYSPESARQPALSRA